MELHPPVAKATAPGGGIRRTGGTSRAIATLGSSVHRLMAVRLRREVLRRILTSQEAALFDVELHPLVAKATAPGGGMRRTGGTFWTHKT